MDNLHFYSIPVYFCRKGKRLSHTGHKVFVHLNIFGKLPDIRS